MRTSRHLLAASLLFNLISLILGGVWVSRSANERKANAAANAAARQGFVASGSYRAGSAYFAQLPRRDGAIVLLGDSITANAEWSEVLGRADVLNRGIPGDTVEGIARRVPEVTRHRPRLVLLMAGINDLRGGESATYVLAQHKKVLQALRTGSPQTRIVLQSILPVGPDKAQALRRNIEEVNRGLKQLTDGKRVIFLDLHSRFVDSSGNLKAHLTIDGLHLNGQGYRVWLEELRSVLNP